jgi:hypothetical protein
MPILIGSWAMAPAGSRSAIAETEAMNAFFMGLLPVRSQADFFPSPAAACTQDQGQRLEG